VHARRPLRLQVKGGPRRALPRAGHDLRVEARLELEVAEREPLQAKGLADVVVLVSRERTHRAVADGGKGAQPVEARDAVLQVAPYGVLSLHGKAHRRAEHGDGHLRRHVDRAGHEQGARVRECDGVQYYWAGEAGDGLPTLEVLLEIAERAHGQRLAQHVDQVFFCRRRQCREPRQWRLRWRWRRRRG